jgi:amino acid adenylation domain-containing protein
MNELNISPSAPPHSCGPTGVLLDSAECHASRQGPAGLRGIEEKETSQALSFSQRQVWLHGQLAADIPLYNTALILTRQGPLKQEALKQALGEILRRHESLRTTFATLDGIPVPMITDRQTVELAITELNGLPEARRDADARRIAEEEVRRPFDLAEGPLMRARLLRMSWDRHILIVILHTLVADDHSLSVYAHEFSTLYEAYSVGEPSPLPELPLQYPDFVNWQRNRFANDVLKRQISFWCGRLAGIPAVLELPTDRPRPRAQTFRGARESLLLSGGLRDELEKLSVRENVSLFVVLLAAFQTLLLRYTRQDDIVVGSIICDRDAVSTERLIGLFASTVPIRTDLGGDPTFRELLRRVSDVTSDALEHRNVPLDQLVSEVQPDWDPSRNPLFQALFSLEPSIALPSSSWEIAGLAVDTGTAKVDLQLQVYNGPRTLQAYFTYNTDLFDAASIVRMAGHFQMLLEGAVVNPDESISRLPLLTEAERHQLVVEWNDTRREFLRERCVHELFEVQADRTPGATAVLFETEQHTYAELNRRANQLAHYLVKLGVGPNTLVGICVERSLEMVVGLLGILKAGGAYVPVDPAFPPDRVAFMLEDAGVPVLLTQQRLIDILPENKARLLCLDTDWPEIVRESPENLANQAKPEDLAYTMYTSGSTGKPKGVQIPHRAVVNFLSSMSENPGMTKQDRLLAVTTLSFDIAGLEIYLPLTVGASVEIVSREVSSDGVQLLAKLHSSSPTVMQATPATWRMLLEAGWQGNAGLKILVGGEAVPHKLVNELLPRSSSVWNMYGPTETTIWSTVRKFEPNDAAVSIGRPIANTEIFILDKELQLVPVGVAGELLIGGDGLAKGYLKRAELTAEKFIAHPFDQEPGARLYRTGDLVRYQSNGDIEFLGRIDHQIKIRGFRIELGEIESVLRQHPAINDTVVVAREDVPGDKRLVAYVVPTHQSVPTIGEFRSFLKERLPEYMLPSAFVPLPEMPLTPNGKINRRALPPPEQSNLAPAEELVEPRDVVETKLVTIWESILGVRPIGIKNDFFELGGHSLLAVRIMLRIEKAFAKKMPVAALLQARTIEQLAVLVRQEEWFPAWTSLVPIQVGGSKPPFFCVHGAGGVVIRFYDLARHLGPDQPFYGLQARGLNQALPCHTRVEEMAAHYINEIRAIQPEGPYFLGGYSLGGNIAFEMAQRLIAEGQKKVLVVLFDTFCAPAQDIDISAKDLRGLLKDVASSMLRFWQMSFEKRRAYVSQKVKILKQGIQRRLDNAKLPEHLKRVHSACAQAAKNYVPPSYPGRVILFRSSHKPLTHLRDPHAGWKRYAAQGLEIYEIEGDHDNILLEPQVRMVARQLKACLEQVQTATHATLGLGA